MQSTRVASFPRRRGPGQIIRSRQASAPASSGPSLSPAQKLQVKQLVSAPVELKRFNYETYAQVSTAVPTNYAIFDLPQGDTDITRDGDAVHLKELTLRFQTWMTATGISTNTNNGVRLIVYKWIQMSTSSAPTAQDVLEDITSNHAFNSDYHWDYLRAGMFKVLYDKRYELCDGNSYKIDDIVIPLKGNVQFSNSAGTLGANKINVLVCTDDLVVPAPEFSFRSLITFSDS